MNIETLERPVDSPPLDRSAPRQLSWQSKLAWCLDPRGWLRAILMLDDTPHSIALGTAIGLFIGFTPTVGIQMVIVVILAFLTSRLFRFNRVAALIAVYVSNPFTMVPIYWFNYRIGTLFFEETVAPEEFARLLHYNSFAEWAETLRAVFVTVGAPLLLGSLVVSSVVGLASYPLVLRLAESVQRHRDHTAHPSSGSSAPH